MLPAGRLRSPTTSTSFEPAADLAGLDALRDRIAAGLEAHLEAQQGTARRAPWRTTVAVVVLVTVVIAGAFVGLAALHGFGFAVFGPVLLMLAVFIVGRCGPATKR